MLEHGDIVAGKFRIERLLAEGGMGAVFRARHLETERSAALKVLWPDVQNSALFVEKFQLEAKVAALVQSEHIVSVLDAGLDTERCIPYLAMELLEGCTLRELSLPIAPATVALYLTQLASALDKAHGYVDQNGEPHPIIHCDLKPDNVFLTHRESGVPEIKILDFGMARMDRHRSTRASEVRGTPLYMAVEQIKGEPLSPQTDIWATGLISFFLLTGRPYWRAGNSSAGLTELLTEILSVPLLTPSERMAQFEEQACWPAAYDTWFLRCVHREPGKRFPSAGEAAREFSRIFSVAGPAQALPRAEPSRVATPDVAASVGYPAGLRPPVPYVLASEPTERLDSMADFRPLAGRKRALGAGRLTHRTRLAGLLGVGALTGAVALGVSLDRPVGAEVRDTDALLTRSAGESGAAPHGPSDSPVMVPVDVPRVLPTPSAAPPTRGSGALGLPTEQQGFGTGARKAKRPESPRTRKPVYRKR